MDLRAVRTFVVVAAEGQFQRAAAELAITQQAVSKRIAGLEAELGVPLFIRTAHGARLTIDGQAFLPHARAVLAAVERAMESVRPGRRALRVDVLGRRLAPAALLQDFHGRHPEVELDVVALHYGQEATSAVHAATLDAAFCARRRVVLPEQVEARPVLFEPLELMTGACHPLATARTLRLRELAGYRIWIPGIVAGTEWAAYYEELAEAFGLSIDATGPNLGTEHLFDVLSDSASVATFVGAHTRLLWTAAQDLRRIPLRDPRPVYPHYLIWRADNVHPGLAMLREHFARASVQDDMWTPSWV